MRRDDPKRIAARDKREAAAIWLDILCKGIGHVLADGYRDYPESTRAVIKKVNSHLSEAVDAAEAANKAYEPYRMRRRTVRPKKTTKAA